MRGRDLTDRMPRQEVRADAPRLRQTEQRHLKSEQRRLRVGGVVDQRLGVLQRPVQVPVELGADRVVRSREGRERAVHLLGHADPLAALAGEEEGRLAAAGRPDAEGGFAPGLAVRQQLQAAQQLRAVASHQRGAVVEACPCGGQRVGDVDGPQLRAGDEMLPQPDRLTAQRVRRPARQHERHHRRRPRHRRLCLRRLDGRGLLDHGVRVGAADPEGGDRGPARPPGLGPLLRLGQQLHRAGRPVHVRGRLGDVQGLRQHAVAHRHDHLDDARHTGGGLGVAQVRLDRPQPQRLFTVLTVGGQQRLRLDRVAQRRAGAVRLDRVHLGGRQSGRRQRLPDHSLLGRPVGRRQTVAGAVLVHRAAAHDGQHRMSVAPRVGEPLHEQHADALAPAGAVRAVGERLATAVHGQAALTAEADERRRSRHHGHPTGQRHRALAAAQRLDRPVQRHQRGRARGVHRHRRALQPEGVGEPARRDTARVAAAEVALAGGRVVLQAGGVVVVHHADEDAGPAAAQGGRVDARPLERLPGGLQQQPLLRIGGHRLTRRDAEERGVELGRVVQEAALAGVRGAGVLRVRVVETLDVPTTVLGEAGDRVPPGGHQIPQLFGRGDPAGEAAGHADDGDRVVLCRRDRGGGTVPLVEPGDADELGAQLPGEGMRVGVVEDHGGGQTQRGRPVETVTQVEGAERVEAEIAEGAGRVDGLGTAVAEHSGDMGPHEVEEQSVLLLRGQADEARAERGVLGCGRGGDATGRRPNQATQQRRQRPGVRLVPQGRAVQPDRHHRCLVRPQRRVEQGQALGGRERQHAAPAHPLDVGRHAAVLGPQPPGQRGRRQSGCPAVLGEGVQEAVGRRVAALTGRAEHPGRRGEHHEGGQVLMARQLMQVPGRVHLRPQHRVNALGRERRDDPVVQHAGRVHHGGQRALQRAQQGRQRGAVRHVARREPRLGAQLRQLGGQLGRALGRSTAPGDQQQPTRAVLGHQVPCEQPAQRARRAGQQHDALGVQCHGGRLGARLHPCQTRRERLSGPQGQLRLTGIHGPGQSPQRRRVLVQVHQYDPAGVLRLRGAQQTRHGGRRKITRGQMSAGRPTRHHHQAGTAERLLRQPLLHQGEYPLHGGTGDSGDIAGLRSQRQHDRARHGLRQLAQILEQHRVREPEVVVTQHRHPAEGPGSGQGHARPLLAEQRLMAACAGPRHLLRREGPQRQRVDGHDRRTGPVGHRERDRVRTCRGDPHPQLGRARRVQRHPRPRERQPALTRVLQQTAQTDRMQRRIQQSRMETEQARLGAALLRQRHLGEHLIAQPPRRPQPLEHRAVTEPGRSERVIDRLDQDRLSTHRRPLHQLEARRTLTLREQTGSMPRPGPVQLRVLRPRVDAQRPASRAVRFAHREAEPQRARRRDDERRLQRQLLQPPAACLVAGRHGQLHERGARQQDAARDRVVGQPWLGLERQPAEEQQPVRVRQRHDGAQQRVIDRLETGRGDIAAGGGTAVQPVALPLEGVGGEVDTSGVRPREDRRPVEPDPAHVQPGQSRAEGLRLGTVSAQHRRELRVLAHALPAEGRERAVRTELQEGVDALALQALDGVAVPDRFADVAHPVLGSGEVGRLVERGDDRDLRGVELQGLRDGPELVQHRVHQRRVERMTDRQPLGLQALGAQLLRDGQDRLLDAGEHDRCRTVDGGDRHLVRQQRQHLVLGCLHRHHRTARGQRLHQPATRGHQLRRVAEREDTRHMRGRDLTNGVPRQEVRTHTPGLDQPEQRHLKSEQRRLRARRLIDPLTREDDLAQRQVQLPVQLRAHRVERRREHRERLVQLPAHPGPLAPLPREQERRPPRRTCRPRHRARRRRAGRKSGQRGQRLVAVADEQRGALLEGRSGRGQREAQVCDVEVGVVGQVLAQARRLGAQRRLVTSGDDQRQRTSHRGRRARERLDHGPLLDDDVRVGPADAERGHRRAARPTGLRPGARLGQQFHRARRPVHVRGGLVHVQGLRQDAVAHRHHHLDDAADARSRLGVPDVGLQRSEPQGALAILSVRGQQGLRLDRVAQPGSRAVRLDRVDLVGGQPRGRQRGADHPLLRRTVGSGQPAARAVLVDGAAAHDRQHRVTVALGVGEPLDQQHADALAPAGAVGRRGEGLAATVGREPALAAEVDEGVGGGHHRHAAGQGHRALTGPQRLDRPVQRHQRGRARGVHRHRRALQAQRVGHPARGDAARVAVAEVAGHALGHVPQSGGVVVVHHAREDAGGAAAQCVGVDAGPLERLPGHLQQQPLLRVHRQRLARRDVEEVGVELGGVVQEAALAGVRAARLLGVLGGEGAQVPAAVDGEVGDAVGPARDEPPEVLGRAHATGVAAGHADDGDRLGLPLLQLAQPPTGLTQIGGRPLEVVEELLFVLHVFRHTPEPAVRVLPVTARRAKASSSGPGMTIN